MNDKMNTQPAFRIVTRIEYLLLLIAVLLSSFIRCRYLELPLERDEGEYAYAGLQIHNGFAAYENAYNMKFPGAYLFFAFIFYFGKTLSVIRIFFLVLHFLQVLFIYLITKNIFQENRPAIYACIIYILLTSSFSSFGLLGKAEPIAVFFFLAGLYVVVRQQVLQKSNALSFIVAGVLLGCSFLMKQNCLLFGCIAAGYIMIFSTQKMRSLLLFSAGFIIPFALLVVHILTAGTFQNFKFFTIDYAQQYGKIVDLKQGWGIFRFEFEKLFHFNTIAFIITGIGFLLVVIKAPFKKTFFFLFIWMICSLVVLSAGYYFRPHYFLLVYPVCAIAAGSFLFAVSSLRKMNISKFIPSIVILISFYFFIHAQSAFIFKDDPDTTMHKMYIWTPFPECVEIGKHINAITNENAKIGMIGNEPEIAFYADRQLASGYMYLYPFFEDQKYALEMTRQFIAETEAGQPEIMIFSNVSWDATKNKACEKVIEDWWEAFSKNYELFESVCSDSDHGVKYFTTEEPRSQFDHWVACIQVYKKRQGQ